MPNATEKPPVPHSTDIPFIRLDSLDPGRDTRSFLFDDLRAEIAAHALHEVVPALYEVERAVATGLHAAGFIAYEAAPALDPYIATQAARSELPLLWFGLFGQRLDAPPPAESPTDPAARLPGPFRRSLAPAEYRAQLARILDWIVAGDTYQVNFTLRLHAEYAGTDQDLYRRLCAAQRAAYCALLRLPRFSIVSASPELFFRWTGAELELRPMKGTRARGRWREEDEALARELAASDKDRAENLMIVDLLRNDAGRVSELGSVRVDRLFELERYPTVHQLTSTIRARTRAGTSLVDVLRALFPSGSVTGAPKVRTSQIIAELEDSPRGPYTGAIGYVSPGESVFSVAIRTLLLDRATSKLELGAGSGITVDSDPGAEYQECLNKAAFVHSRARAFRLLTSLRFERGAGYLLLDAHLARLAESAAYFGYTFDARRARTALLAHADELSSGGRKGSGVHKVRILCDRGGAVEVGSEEIPARSGTVRVGIAPEPIDESDPLLYHKTTNRDIYVSRAASRPECDDVLLVNGRGELADATTANIVVKLDGALYTPPIEAGPLPGIFRAHLLQRGEIHVRRLAPADLARADAVFLINAVRGWREARLARSANFATADDRADTKA